VNKFNHLKYRQDIGVPFCTNISEIQQGSPLRYTTSITEHDTFSGYLQW